MLIEKIVASLQYGRFFNNRLLIILYIILYFTLLFPLLTIIIVILTAFGLKWDNESLLIFTLGNVINFLLISYPAYLILYNKALKKKIITWLDDIIEVKAYSKTLDRFRTAGQPFFEVKIEVSFIIDKKKYVRISGDGKRKNKIYQKIFAKYADREINILYSPKYDQVLILKD